MQETALIEFVVRHRQNSATDTLLTFCRGGIHMLSMMYRPAGLSSSTNTLFSVRLEMASQLTCSLRALRFLEEPGRFSVGAVSAAVLGDSRSPGRRIRFSILALAATQRFHFAIDWHNVLRCS
jgi:hypothetical protein